MAKTGPKYRALVATNDSSLSHLLRAILASARIDVKVSAVRSLHTAIDEDDFTLLIIDGDITEPFVYGNTALIAISPSNSVAAYDLGADMVIDKPIVANIFLAKVRSVLRRYGTVI